MKKGSSKRFCIWGHDTFACGRDKWHQCKDCGKREFKIYYDKHRNELILKQIKWQKEHPEKVKAINETAKRKKYIEEYNKQYAPKKKEWRENNKALVKISHSRSKGNRRLRVPKWGQEGILEFYGNCPLGMRVDHFIPIQGKLISGLDVIWNLQYLTPAQNSKKYNKCNLIEASIWYGKLLKEIESEYKESTCEFDLDGDDK
jgi:5-methylcytosine-specific restriction endonuclease McrA